VIGRRLSPNVSNKRMRRLALAAALMLALPAAGRAQELGLSLGTKAPAAAVQTLDGRATDLAQYVGKAPVLIEFWATWCPNCRALEPQMLAAAKKYAGKVGFVTVAVSVNQSPERVKAYAQKHGLPGTIVFDKSGAASEAYDAPATSYIVVLDRTGKVVYTGQGSEQNIDAAVRKAL
jgi:thiol-disulfide isomerase/thioredoxin